MMGWMEAVGTAIQYVEEHITEDLSAEEIAKQVNLSPFYFQKGFAMLCGFTLAEYIRNRRLALAGGELAAGSEKVIDIALKYGYDSPDSFTKAFTRFHGVTPSQVRKEQVMLKSERFFLTKARRSWFPSSGSSTIRKAEEKRLWGHTASISTRKWDRILLNI